MEEKQQELETERKELAEYQLLDKQKRALEYVLTDKELAKIKERIEELESARVGNTSAITELRQQEALINEGIATVREQMATAQAEVNDGID